MLFLSLSSSGFCPLPFVEGKFVEGFACLCNFVVKKACLWKVLRVCVIL